MAASHSRNPPRVAYISSPSARQAADRLPSNLDRSSPVHRLIEAFGLLNHDDTEDSASHLVDANVASSVHAVKATRNDLLRFHDAELVDALLSPQPRSDKFTAQTTAAQISRLTQPDDSDVANARLDHFGLEYDCPRFPELAEYVCEIAGGSLTAAKELREQRADIAIFWDGGRHHATKTQCNGFCYVNDIVLAILELQRPRPRSAVKPGDKSRLSNILYIDLDLHHGDGVAEAFINSANVTTVSIHHWSRGFYPSESHGALDYTGPTEATVPGAGRTLNIVIPQSQASGDTLIRLVNSCLRPIYVAVDPDAVVIQCGVDGLAGDPCREFNYDLRNFGRAVQAILSWAGYCAEDHYSTRKPVLLLGGGGYNNANAARAWTYLTSIALGRPLRLNGFIPDDCKDWDIYGPSFELDVPCNDRQDQNTETYLLDIEAAFRTYVGKLKKR